jgi:flavin-dependent dehydrogenase
MSSAIRHADAFAAAIAIAEPSVAEAFREPLLRQSLGHEAGEDYPDGLLADAVFRATPPLTHHTPPVAGAEANVFRVGDAAGYVEPFTGEGIGWALASARIAADTILQGAGAAGIGEVYAGAHHRHFVVPHARCRRVSSWLQSPALVTAAVASARIAPGLAARVVPLVTGAGGRGGQR